MSESPKSESSEAEPEQSQAELIRGTGFAAMSTVGGDAERAIRQVVGRLLRNPEERRDWIRKETMTQAAILAYKARNAQDLDDVRRAAEGFQKVVAPMLKVEPRTAASATKPA